MTYDFTAKDVLNEVVRLSEEDPDFVYTTQPGREGGENCGYAGLTLGTTEGRSCIIGQALQNLGVSKNRLCHMSGTASRVVKDLLHIEDEGNTDILRLLDRVQLNQDAGLRWRTSVIEASREVEGVLHIEDDDGPGTLTLISWTQMHQDSGLS